jgi:selenide,water dikinase
LDAAWNCIEQGTVPGGTMSNLRYLERNLEFHCSQNWQLITADPQTSGGLLLSVPEEKAGILLEKLSKVNQFSRIIGRVVQGQAGKITVYEEEMTTLK